MRASTRSRRPLRTRSNPDELLTAAEAADIRQRSEAYERAREKFDPKRFKRGGGYSPADVAAIEAMAGVAHPSNAELGRLELYEFMTNPPDKYFLYVKQDKNPRPIGSTLPDGIATTWTGDKLGTIFFGKAYRTRSPFGGVVERIPVRVHAVNGFQYAGTYYASTGNYARVKRVKSRARR